MLRIMAPVASYEGAKLQVQAGADEIYLGLDNPNFKNLNFSGRGKGANVSTVKELKKIVKFCHENNVSVNYAANIPFMVDDFEDLFIEHVELGVSSEVDGLILGELGSILLVNEHNFDIPLIAGVFNNVFNVEHVKLLKNLGVSRVILPHKLTLNEMKEIINTIDDIEYEVFGHFGCSNINGRCLLIHAWGENVNLGLVCRAKYNVYANSAIHNNVCILDAGTDCTICSLHDLANIGVNVIKIVGRDKDPFFTSTITRVYREFIDNIYSNKIKRTPVSLNRDKILKREPWWSYFCDDNRCKYRPNRVSRSYV